MELQILAAALAMGAVAFLGVASWYTFGGAGATMNRRVQNFVKGQGQPQRTTAASDLAGGRRRSGRQVSAVESTNRLIRSLDTMAERAQVEIRGIETVGICLGLAVVFFLLGWLVTGAAAAGIPAALVGAYVPVFWLRRRYSGLAKKFHRQLSDTTTLLASSVRAGNALPRAFERVAAEAPEPTRGVFHTAVREMGLGLPLEEALDRIAERYPSEEMSLLVASINVQYQVGGNLGKVLDLISETLRERARILGDIRSLTAQQRYSAYLLSAMPVFVTLLLFFVSPSYIGILFRAPYYLFLVASAGLVLVGFYLMQQLAKVDV